MLQWGFKNASLCRRSFKTLIPYWVSYLTPCTFKFNFMIWSFLINVFFRLEVKVISNRSSNVAGLNIKQNFELFLPKAIFFFTSFQDLRSRRRIRKKNKAVFLAQSFFSGLPNNILCQEKYWFLSTKYIMLDLAIYAFQLLLFKVLNKLKLLLLFVSQD